MCLAYLLSFSKAYNAAPKCDESNCDSLKVINVLLYEYVGENSFNCFINELEKYLYAPDIPPPKMESNHPYKDKIKSNISSESLKNTFERVVPYYEKKVLPSFSFIFGSGLMFLLNRTNSDALIDNSLVLGSL